MPKDLTVDHFLGVGITLILPFDAEHTEFVG